MPRVEGLLGDLAVADDPHPGGGRGGQLVQAVVTAEHQRRRAALGQYTGDQSRHPGVEAADRRGGHLGGVGQRAEQVERCGDAQVPPHPADEPHRGVELGGEAEGDPGLLHDPRHPFGRQVEVDAELLQHVGRPARRGGGPVAVLDDLRAGAGDHDGGHRRDVDRLGQVAARTDDVDGRTRDVQRLGVRVHRLDEAGDLLDRLPLGSQRHHEAGDLRVRGLAAHEAVHRPRRVRGAQVPSAEQRAQYPGPGTVRRGVASCGGHSAHKPLLDQSRTAGHEFRGVPPYPAGGTAKGPVRCSDGALLPRVASAAISGGRGRS